METLLWIVGTILFSLAWAGLQRLFFPHTIANGFMDLDKLKEICPEFFTKKKHAKKETEVSSDTADD